MILEKFKEYMILEGLAEKSVLNYYNIVSSISKNIDLESITQENINNFFLNLNKPDRTREQYKKSLLKFLKYKNLDLKIPKFKNPEQNIPNYFDEDYFLDEIVPLIKDLFVKEIQVRCLFYIMFYTGLRVGEIANLKLEDFDMKNRRINIQKRKAKNPIVIYYPEEISDLIEIYITTYVDSEYLFSIDEQSIRRYCTEISKNLDKKITPHTFRHSFAVMFLKNGGDISVLKELLGHRSLQSTLIYAKMTNEDIEKEYRKIVKIKRRPKNALS